MVPNICFHGNQQGCLESHIANVLKHSQKDIPTGLGIVNYAYFSPFLTAPTYTKSVNLQLKLVIKRLRGIFYRKRIPDRDKNGSALEECDRLFGHLQPYQNNYKEGNRLQKMSRKVIIKKRGKRVQRQG